MAVGTFISCGSQGVGAAVLAVFSARWLSMFCSSRKVPIDSSSVCEKSGRVSLMFTSLMNLFLMFMSLFSFSTRNSDFTSCSDTGVGMFFLSMTASLDMAQR